MKRAIILSLLIQMIVLRSALAQAKISSEDSVNMKYQIEGFYSMYISLIKNSNLDAFNPRFVKRKDGMTTLDFKKYEGALRKYGFSDAFIKRKIVEYKKCKDNLEKISFNDFSKLTDLEDMEGIECDFPNRYEWTGGQEPKDKAKLSQLRVIDEKTIIGDVDFISNQKPDGHATVTFRKIANDWKIDDLKLE